MRKLLMAGVALGAVSALVSARPALAQQAPAPDAAAVFPITTETDLAGVNGPSLNGAAPGSVQVNLGARMYGAMWFQSNPSGTPSTAVVNGKTVSTGNAYKEAQPQLESWFQLYPGFDYASPSGVHFGAQASLWMTQNGETNNSNNSGVGVATPAPFFHDAFGYVSSAQYGKFWFGTPNGALTSTAVGTGDDFGTGMFFSWYSTNPYVPWAMGDAYDNYGATEKLMYSTPTFSGFSGAISWTPTAVGLNWGDGAMQAQLPGSSGLNSQNRVEIAGKYDGTVGIVGLKVDAGYVFANAEKAGVTTVGQNVSFGNFGLQVNVAGFEFEGSVNTGQFNYAIADDNGNDPLGPLPVGAKGTTAFVLGAGYGAGPFKVGAVYYGVQYDEMDMGAATSAIGHVSGEGLGGSYTVGPGVVAYLDFITASVDGNGGTGPAGKQHPTGLGLGTFFTW